MHEKWRNNNWLINFGFILCIIVILSFGKQLFIYLL